jgi:tetratricopeptide (TPR) repeat protein
MSLAQLVQLQEKRGLRDEAAATTRQIAERIDQLARASGDRPHRVQVALQLSELAPHLRLAGKNVEAHRAAELSRQLYEALVREAPEELSFQVGLSQAWFQCSKYYWRVADHERVLSALNQAVAVQRRVIEKAPAPEHLAVLDDRLIRRERALDALGRREEVLRSIKERKELWAGNSGRLRVVAADLRKLAAGVGPKCGPLSREELLWKDRYLAESTRILRQAEELPRAAAGGHRR